MFDFDGTILDTEQSVYQSWAELWQEQGVELSRRHWQGIIGTDAGFDPWIELERAVGVSLDPALQDRRRDRRDELQATYVPRDGVVTWLEEARRLGLPVAVASSSPIEWVQGHLRRLGLDGFFVTLVCRDESTPAKPDPTSYRLACRRLGARPRWSVAVDDSPHGVDAAVTAGLYTIALPHGLTADLDLSRADVVTASLAGLRLADAVAAARARPPQT